MVPHAVNRGGWRVRSVRAIGRGHCGNYGVASVMNWNVPFLCGVAVGIILGAAIVIPTALERIEEWRTHCPGYADTAPYVDSVHPPGTNDT